VRKYLFVYIVLGVLVLAGFLLFATSLKLPAEPEIDTVALNEITKQAALCWQDLNRLDDMDFEYRFFILDNGGKLCYQSHGDLPDTLQAALRVGFLPLDIIVDGKVVGKAVIETIPEAFVVQAQNKLTTAIIIAFVVLCALLIAVLMVLYALVIRPFGRLESFAHSISTGRFDEPLPMDRNNMFGLFTQSFDVMRTSLLEAREKQLALERAQKELIASLNHDIKTPITSISLISELLQASGVDPEVEEKLKVIDMKADQIGRLMNDMLHSALEELGELKVTPTCRESSELLGLFTSADYLSKTRIGPVPTCLVEFDMTRMEQVIGNIIVNSYKYAGTEIDVSFRIDEGFLHIDISDYGKGVNPDELELICTKFYRGENALALHKEGEGLGLYTAKQLMVKMGGGLEAINRDPGFTIKLWLPLSQ